MTEDKRKGTKTRNLHPTKTTIHKMLNSHVFTACGQVVEQINYSSKDWNKVTCRRCIQQMGYYRKLGE